MTVKEAILTLRANAVLACERAGFSSATVKMIEDALDIIDGALKEQEAEPGHWIVLENQPNAGVYCSECNTKIFDHYPMKKKYSYFCPHCGTRMEGEAVKCELKNTSLKP